MARSWLLLMQLVPHCCVRVSVHADNLPARQQNSPLEKLPATAPDTYMLPQAHKLTVKVPGTDEKLCTAG